MLNRLVVCDDYLRKIILLNSDNSILKLKYEQDDANINDIYIVRVVKYLSQINAYFVEFYDKNNEKKNGFIKGSNIHNIYYSKHYLDIFIRMKKFHDRLSCLQKSKRDNRILKCNTFIVAQVLKDGINNKRDSFTTSITLSFKFLTIRFFDVPCIGISQQIKGEMRHILRTHMQEILKKKNLGNLHVVVKCNAQDASFDDLYNDLSQIINKWNKLVGKVSDKSNQLICVYKHFGFLENIILNTSMKQLEWIITDNKDVYQELKRVLRRFFPNEANKLSLYKGLQPVLQYLNISNILNTMMNRYVFFLKKAYIAIDRTEAGIVIDVNSGNENKNRDMDYNFYINKNAISIIIQQIVIRNLSSLIIIDFIEMDQAIDRENIEKELAAQLKQYSIDLETSKLNEFCILTLSKKRKHMNTYELFTTSCKSCDGKGVVFDSNYNMYQTLLNIKEKLYTSKHNQVVVDIPISIANHFINHYRDQIYMLEKQYNKKIVFNFC